MKKFLVAIIALTLTAMVVFISDMIIHRSHIGAFFILEISILSFLLLFSFVSLFLYKKKGKGKIITNLWVLILSLALAYFTSDLVAGYFLIKPSIPNPNKHLYIRDQYVHHKFKSNIILSVQSQEGGLARLGLHHTIRINNTGLRGKDIEPVKNKNLYRILMLGDSFTQGAWVEDSETFSVLLEKSLNDHNVLIKGKSIEILNAGVNSYSPILSFLQLKRNFGKLEPDLVVLNFDMSDLIQEVVYRKAATYDANGEIIGVDGRKKKPEKTLFSLKLAVRRWIDRNLYMTKHWCEDFCDTIIKDDCRESR